MLEIFTNRVVFLWLYLLNFFLWKIDNTLSFSLWCTDLDENLSVTSSHQCTSLKIKISTIHVAELWLYQISESIFFRLSFCFSSTNRAENFREFGFWYVWLKNSHKKTKMLQNCGYIEPMRYQILAIFLLISFCFSYKNLAKNFREFSLWHVWLKNIHIWPECCRIVAILNRWGIKYKWNPPCLHRIGQVILSFKAFSIATKSP